MVTPDTSQFDEGKTLELAAAYAKEKNFEQAILSLKDLLAHNAQHAIAAGMLAAIYAEIGLHTRAIQYYAKVLAISPNNPLARLHLGLSQLANRQPADALESWRPALSQPHEFLAHYYSGLALLQLKKKSEALNLLRQAAQRMPQSHPLYPSLQDLLAGGERP